jgi:leucyl aminopeptidase
MPLDPVFKKDMEGKISDLQNMGNMGRYAGACTAAGFLEHFVENDCPWAHMDIAGTAWIKSDKATAPKPATGFGVRILNQMIANSYEGK